ncbi:MAG: hypothetical protein JSR77_06940 [Planctomycetes bacterium]|nr:hypothetical protein [Planctomycetota bacterium]
MFGSVSLEVLIGLVTFFFLLSTISSATSELWFAFWKTRARLLEQALMHLSDKLKGAGTKAFDVDALLESVKPSGDRKPSYIPPKVFMAQVISDTFNIIAQPTNVNGPTTVAPDAQAPDVIKCMWKAADQNLEEFKILLEEWFNVGMSDAGEIFKRKAHWVLGAVGLAIAVALNGDAFMVARALMVEPATRAKLLTLSQQLGTATPTPVKAAQPAAAAPTATPPTTLPELAGEIAAMRNELSTLADLTRKSSSGALTAADFSTLAAAGSGQQLTQDQQAAARESALKALWSSGLPLGWSDQRGAINAWPWLAGSGWEIFRAFCLKIVGLLATAMAVSFGAPFWFDLLAKFTNPRLAGPKPD